MKCIVADDEYLVRFSIIDMIKDVCENGNIPLEETLEARDGAQLLGLMRQMHPDVVFLDIRMPGINGLDAMAEGRKISPDTVWIILTGYAEFSYAKRALTLGAADYLVKPASEADIGRTLLEVQDTLRKKQKNRKLELERCLLGLMHDTISDEYASFIEGDWSYVCTAVFLDRPIDSKEPSEDYLRLKASIQKALSQNDSLPVITAMVSLYDGTLLLCYAEEGGQELLQEVQIRTSEYLHGSSDTKEYLCTQLLGKQPKGNLSEVIEFSKRASAAAVSRIGYGFGDLIDEEAFSVWEALPEEIDDCSRALGSLETQPEQTSAWFHAYPERLAVCLENDTFRGYMGFLSGLQLQGVSSETASGLITRWVEEKVLQYAGTMTSEQKHRLVSKALEIMQQRFTEEIGLAQVAEMLQVTPNHLSAQFSKVTGGTFTHAITELRMEYAQQLLQQKELTVREISERCGYGSSRHFSKVFKKWFGTSPSQFSDREPYHRK